MYVIDTRLLMYVFLNFTYERTFFSFEPNTIFSIIWIILIYLQYQVHKSLDFRA